MLQNIFFAPAKDNAPAGSDIILVSSKISFMAPQVSSMETKIVSSTYCFAISKVFFLLI
ncbi:MAG: hypothetical protein CM15mP93_02250 [Thiotrichaceae bacterium]|nr:MAG: hypothetical protein CM15mP93_02250 [Thiotrichaceae bacterium]